MLEKKRFCGYRAHTAGAEQLQEGDHPMDGENEEFAHRANRTMTASVGKTARRRRIRSYYEFASHRPRVTETGPCEVAFRRRLR